MQSAICRCDRPGVPRCCCRLAGRAARAIRSIAVAGFDDVLANAPALARRRRGETQAAGLSCGLSARLRMPARRGRSSPLPRTARRPSATRPIRSPRSAREVAPRRRRSRSSTRMMPAPFAKATLQPLLAAARDEWLIVAGVWTEACVAATVRDAIAAGLSRAARQGRLRQRHRGDAPDGASSISPTASMAVRSPTQRRRCALMAGETATSG